MMCWRSGVVGCIHPEGHNPLEVHHSHGRCVYYAYLLMNDLHFHVVLNDQNGPLGVSQTSLFPLGLGDRLFKTKVNMISELFYV